MQVVYLEQSLGLTESNFGRAVAKVSNAVDRNKFLVHSEVPTKGDGLRGNCNTG